MLKNHFLIRWVFCLFGLLMVNSGWGQDLTSITKSDASVFSISSGAQNSQTKSVDTKAASSQKTPFAIPLSLLLPQQAQPSGAGFESIDAFSGLLSHRYLDMNVPGNGGFDLQIWRSYTASPSSAWSDLISVSPGAFGESIDPNTGRLYPRVHLTGGGYVSGHLGANWDIHFGLLWRFNPYAWDSRVNNVCDDWGRFGVTWLFMAPDGSRQTFFMTKNGLISRDQWKIECLADRSGVMVFAPNGTKYQMSQPMVDSTAYSRPNANQLNDLTRSFVLFSSVRITDRNNNVAQIDYSNNRMSKISTNDGRFISFNVNQTSGLIESIESSMGDKVSYSYLNYQNKFSDKWRYANFVLASAVQSDSKVWRYNYADSNYPAWITGVTYPEGGWIQYQFGTLFSDFKDHFGVVRKTDSAGGWWNYSYGGEGDTRTNTVTSALGTITTIFGSKKRYDAWTREYGGGSYGTKATLILFPDGTTHEQKYDVLLRLSDNYLSMGGFCDKTYGINSQFLSWSYGLPLSKTTYGLQTEIYTWGFVDLGPTGCGVSNYAMPRLNAKQVTRDGGNFITEYSNFNDFYAPQNIKEIGPSGEVRNTSFGYYNNTNKWIVNQVQDQNIEGVLIQRSFDNNGNLTQLNQSGVITRYTYDNFGNITSTTSPRGFTSTFSNHKLGIAQQENHPEGLSIRRVVDGRGLVVSETDGEGSTKSFTYDNARRLTRVQYPQGNPLTIEYEASKGKIERRGDWFKVYGVDGFGRDWYTKENGVEQFVLYDTLGRKYFQSYPKQGTNSATYGVITDTSVGEQYEFDGLNRITKLVLLPKVGIWVDRKFFYSANSIAITDERTASTQYIFKAFGNPDEGWLTAVKLDRGLLTHNIQRNNRGQVISISQGFLQFCLDNRATGRKDCTVSAPDIFRTFEYDNRGYLIAATHPEVGRITYTRDEVGNMTSKTVGGNTINYNYDGLNRLITTQGSTTFVKAALNTFAQAGSSMVQSVKQLFSSTPAPASNPLFNATDAGVITNTYNKNGLLTQVSRQFEGRTNTRQFTYDANGNLTTESWVLPNLPTFSANYTYNANDALSVMSYPSSRSVSFAPDVFGRATQVSGYVSNVAYWPNEQVSSMTYANGEVVRSELDVRQKISRLFDSSNKYDVRYAYDGVGNVLSKNVTGSVIGNNTEAYNYDAVYRLISVNSTLLGSSNFNYDSYNNITSINQPSLKVASPVQLSYDSQNRLVKGVSSNTAAGKFSLFTLEYDGLGNVTNAFGNRFVFDGYSNLRCVNCDDAARRIEYDYDGLQQRTLVVKNGLKTYEFYNTKGVLLAEYIDDGNKPRWVEHVYVGGKRVAQYADSKGISVDVVLDRPDNSVRTVKGSVKLKPVKLGSILYIKRNDGLVVSQQRVTSDVMSFSFDVLNPADYSLVAQYVDADTGYVSVSKSVPFTLAISVGMSLDRPDNSVRTVKGSVKIRPVTLGSLLYIKRNDGLVVSQQRVTSDVMSFSFDVLNPGDYSLVAQYVDADTGYVSVSKSVPFTLSATQTPMFVAIPLGIEKGKSFEIKVLITGNNPTGQITISGLPGADRVLDVKKLSSLFSTQYTAASTAVFNTAGTYPVTVQYSGDKANQPSRQSFTISVFDPALYPVQLSVNQSVSASFGPITLSYVYNVKNTSSSTGTVIVSRKKASYVLNDTSNTVCQKTLVSGETSCSMLNKYCEDCVAVYFPSNQTPVESNVVTVK